MVDLEQDVRWEYSEGPSIGSYVQVSSGRSNRAPRNTRTRRHSDDALGRSLLDDTPETPDIDLYRLQPPGANPTSLKGRACWHVTRWLGTIGKAVGEDWLLLLLLGASTALIGFVLDICIRQLQSYRQQLVAHSEVTVGLLIWVAYSCALATLAVMVTHYLSPHAIGSGIPEMKVILKGTNLAKYLAFPTLASKVLGLTLALGSGLPIGKEGPFVHISSIIAQLLMGSVAAFRKLMANDARRIEILASACAVGVASDFGAPIGGVLFSIEVTSTYFAVRNYWRGFFASVVGASVFRVLAMFASSERTITLLFTTDFQKSPFEIWELPAFLAIGVACGFLGAAFVWTHRRVVELRRQWEQSLVFLHKSRYAYVVCVSIVIACVTFPNGIGPHLGLAQNAEISHLFSSEPLKLRKEWAHGNIFVNLLVFIFFKFFLAPLAVSLPIPAGVFVPVFVLGAGVGRLGGELMAEAFPWDDAVIDLNATGVPCVSDVEYDGIVPGGYAVVGAAALAGAVTQTISTSVIVFELTGQLHHILPVMICVLIANMICQKFQPSIYDSIIQMKKLPYLPDLRKGDAYNMTAADIMRPDVDLVSLQCSYRTISTLLDSSNSPVFPLVESVQRRFLVGAVKRVHLEALLEVQTEMVIESEFDDESDVDAPLKPNVRRQYSGTGRGGQNGESDDGMSRMIDLSGVPIDPSPFQVVDKMSLYKIHTLFSLLGVSVAYVTTKGILVGVIGSDELKIGIETAGERRSSIPHPQTRINFQPSDLAIVGGSSDDDDLNTVETEIRPEWSVN